MIRATPPVAAVSPVLRRRATGTAWAGAMLAAVLVTFTRPTTWVVALAGFLARGGILVLALPIVVLPTPSGLQNALGAPVSSVLFGAPSQQLLLMAVGGILGAALLLVAGTFAGAWAERVGMRMALEAAADETGTSAPDLAGAPGPGRIAIVRLLGLVPVALALVASASAVYAAVYQELVLPAELRTPLPLRIVGDAPATFVVIGVAWLVGDTAAALGVRRLMDERLPALVAWLLGWWDLVRHLPRVLATAVLTVGALAVCVAPGLLAAVVGWARVRETFLEAHDPVAMGLAVLLWVAGWLGVLVLAGVASAFRNAAWTFLFRKG